MISARVVTAALVVLSTGCASVPPRAGAAAGPSTAPIPDEARDLLGAMEREPPGARDVDLLAACDAAGTPAIRDSGALYDRARGRWVIADVGHEPGEPPRVSWFGVATPLAEEAFGATPPEGCRALGSRADLVVAPNLVAAHADSLHALGVSRSLVQVGGWFLFADTRSEPLDELRAFRAGGEDHHVLATRPAATTPVEGGERRAGSRGAADRGSMRAWIGITAVRRAPDGSSLLVQGYRGPPDHPGAGPLHWVIPLSPADARIGG